MRIGTRTILLGLLVLAGGFFAGRACAPAPETAGGSLETAKPAESARPTVWTCTMHPQVRLPAPGKCPICFMDLIPLREAEGGSEAGPRTLAISAEAAALADIETAPVERRLVAHEVRMVGKIAYDETRLAYITTRVAGRLDRLYVDYTGLRVRAGDHLAEIYSPALYTAQQELVEAMRTSERLAASPVEVLRVSSERTVASAREKLRLYGMTEAQIQAVVERGAPAEHVTLLAPIGGIVVHKNALEGMYVDEGTRIYTIADLSKVWALLEAYESDLAWLRYGQDVSFRVAAYPGETFHARIAFIDPVLDDRTRTVKVRLNVDDADRRLKPDMFVSAVAQAKLTPHGRVVDPELAGRWMCPMHPEVLADGPSTCPECGMDLVPASELGFVPESEAREPPLIIPATAPLVTGERAVVYVRLPGRERPTFEGREVVLGPRAGDWYVVRSGLTEGEEVVVNGNFKLDSELQIRAQPSMMSPEGGAAPPGHEHAATHAAQAAPGAPAGPAAARVAPPAAFRAALGALADAYLELQTALAGDDDGASAGAARALQAALHTVDPGTLRGGAPAAWAEHAEALEREAAATAGARDLAARRVALEPLTRELIAVLERFGYARDGEDLVVLHCPMAFDGRGGDWIQLDEAVANPYYGSSMLRCGNRTRVLAQEP
jgi:membrane fusion protein, copper/silver efflux system